MGLPNHVVSRYQFGHILGYLLVVFPFSFPPTANFPPLPSIQPGTDKVAALALGTHFPRPQTSPRLSQFNALGVRQARTSPRNRRAGAVFDVFEIATGRIKGLSLLAPQVSCFPARILVVRRSFGISYCLFYTVFEKRRFREGFGVNIICCI